jgi:hypothetical protein
MHNPQLRSQVIQLYKTVSIKLMFYGQLLFYIHVIVIMIHVLLKLEYVFSTFYLVFNGLHVYRQNMFSILV